MRKYKTIPLHLVMGFVMLFCYGERNKMEVLHFDFIEVFVMYARKDIRTVLPDAVLRCRKIQTASHVELEEMEKMKYRRINTIQWQQQSFQRTLNERHKRWRVYDRAFRLKLKRELGTDLATALRLRTIQDEEEKYRFEQELIEQSLSKPKNDSSYKNGVDDDETEDSIQSTPVIPDSPTVAKASSAHPSQSRQQIDRKCFILCSRINSNKSIDDERKSISC